MDAQGCTLQIGPSEIQLREHEKQRGGCQVRVADKKYTSMPCGINSGFDRVCTHSLDGRMRVPAADREERQSTSQRHTTCTISSVNDNTSSHKGDGKDPVLFPLIGAAG